MGEGGELERALDDATGTGSTMRSCCEKRFRKKNFAKDAKILHLSRKYFTITAQIVARSLANFHRQ